MNRRGLRWIHAPAGFSPASEPTIEQPVNPRLAARNLCFRYPGETEDVLQKAELSGAGGEIIALTGGNGSGKTTLAMLLCGLFKERQGQIYIDGRMRKARERLVLCRLVLQEADHQLFTESVFQELRLGLSGNGDHRTRIMELLNQIGLGDKAHLRPQSLSGGEKQRLTVAAALVAEPAMLILDEPTSGLDAGNMGRMGAVLKHAAGRGSLVLVITHDEEFIQTCCTRVLRMEKGGIVDA
jgi:energy-coupling factor transporter ATP-binding protein EcfA2